jgi:hypothetical protein
MDKKADGKPMKELLKRLEKKSVEVVRFGDELLLIAPVDEWPECQVLIAFYSDGFPLGKAMEYRKKYPKMLSLNDLSIQNHLFDRRWVYKLCDENNIPTPRRLRRRTVDLRTRCRFGRRALKARSAADIRPLRRWTARRGTGTRT